MTTRREFITIGGMTVVGLAGFELEGCTFAGTMAKLAQYLPIGLRAVAGVAAIVAPGPGTAVAAILGMVSSSFGILQGAVNDYSTAPATSKQTTLEKVLLALDEVQRYLDQAVKALGFNPTNVALQGAQAALTLVIATLGSIEATLAPQAAPVAATTHLAHGRAVKARIVSVTVNGVSVAVTGNPKDFQKSYNAVMGNAGRPDLEIH